MKNKKFSLCLLVLLSLTMAACSDVGSNSNQVANSNDNINKVKPKEQESTFCFGPSFGETNKEFLYDSIKFGHAACVKKVLDSGLDPNSELEGFGSREKINPLFLALESTFFLTKDKTAILRFLVEAGANLKIKKSDMSIAHYLVKSFRSDDIEVVDYLLSLENLPLNEEYSGNTPLTYAINENNITYAEKLIKNNADLNKSKNLEKPIRLALRKNMFGLVNIMVQKGAILQIAENGNTILHEAILKSDAVIKSTNSSLFTNIIKRMNKKEIQTQNNQEETVLLLAVKSGLLDVVELLLAEGADVNISSKQNSVLVEAIKRNNFELYKLIAGKTSIFGSRLDGVPLIIATQLGNEQIVDDLLIKNVNINETNANQESALHLANTLSIMKKLVDSGANLNAIDKNGQSALFNATKKNHKDQIVFLLSRDSINRSIIDVNGETVLFSATDLESLNLLITKDNIDIVNIKGMTVLNKILREHLSVYDNTKLNMIKSLLENGTNVSKSNEKSNLLNLIVSARTKVDQQDEVMVNHYLLIRLFLNKVDINKADSAGNTVFHVVDTEAELLELLKSSVRIDLRVLNKNGKSALKIHEDIIQDSELRIDIINYNIEINQKYIKEQQEILANNNPAEDQKNKIYADIERFKKTIEINENDKTNFYYPLILERSKIIKLLKNEMNK